MAAEIKPGPHHTSMKQLLRIVSKIKFFQDKNLKEDELFELCCALSFEAFEAGHDVVSYGTLFHLIMDA